MTTLKSGARSAAPKSPSPTTATQPSPISPPVDDDSRIQYLARRVADGHPLTDAARAWLPGRGSRHEAPWALAADIGLAGFPTFAALAKAIFEHDADRRELIERALAVATGRLRLDETSRPIFLSSLRRLRGTVPAELAAALDLAETASFGNVAERLAERMSPKREGAR